MQIGASGPRGKSSTCPHLRCDVGLEDGEYKQNIVYHYNGGQWYEQFSQVGRLYRALISLGLALCLLNASVSSVFMVLCGYFLIKIWLTSFSLPFSELSLVNVNVKHNY